MKSGTVALSAPEIVQYMESCLSPYHSLTPAETFSIEKIIHKSGCDKVFSILDDAFYDKIKYENNRMTLESKNEFMNAISSYSYVKSLSGAGCHKSAKSEVSPEILVTSVTCAVHNFAPSNKDR